MYEGGFRSYFRERLPQVSVLEAVSTFESDTIGQEVTERLLQRHPDLRGLYVSGGGITGVLAGLRAATALRPASEYSEGSGRSGRPAPRLQCVGHELVAATRTALLDGTMLMVFAHPFDAMARATLALSRQLVAGKSAASEPVPSSAMLPFEIYTSENL
jgi:LacI family transcriptional regulator